jgi:HAMP domain-containing protein
MTDLVERLRGAVLACPPNTDMLMEAADEIEQLQLAVERLRQLLEIAIKRLEQIHGD